MMERRKKDLNPGVSDTVLVHGAFRPVCFRQSISFLVSRSRIQLVFHDCG